MILANPEFLIFKKEFLSIVWKNNRGVYNG
jgi:hypothetical protein